MYKNIETKDVLFFLFQLHGSTGTSVILDRVSLQAKGTFTCEFNTYPEFIIKSGSKLIRGHSSTMQIQNHFSEISKNVVVMVYADL